MQIMKYSKGLTLIEVMVVVTILGILSGLVIYNIGDAADKARVKATKSTIQSVAQALEVYRLDNHNYPSTDQGIEALLTKPQGGSEVINWGPKPYLKKVPLDGWGREFYYISPGVDAEYELISFGKDGQEGGVEFSEDIHSD